MGKTPPRSSVSIFGWPSSCPSGINPNTGYPPYSPFSTSVVSVRSPRHLRSGRPAVPPTVDRAFSFSTRARDRLPFFPTFFRQFSDPFFACQPPSCPSSFHRRVSAVAPPNPAHSPFRLPLSCYLSYPTPSVARERPSVGFRGSPYDPRFRPRNAFLASLRPVSNAPPVLPPRHSDQPFGATVPACDCLLPFYQTSDFRPPFLPTAFIPRFRHPTPVISTPSAKDVVCLTSRGRTSDIDIHTSSSVSTAFSSSRLTD